MPVFPALGKGADSIANMSNYVKISPKTVEYYMLTVRNFIEFVQKSLLDVSDMDVEFYLQSYARKGNQASTINNERRNLSAFFTWMRKSHLRSDNPVDSVEPYREMDKPIDHLSDGELEALRDACKVKVKNKVTNLDEYRESLRDRALLEFLRSTAVRVSECVSVNVQDINWQSGELMVYGQKNRTWRTVCLDDTAKYHLRKYIDSRNDKEPALFISSKSDHKRLAKPGIESAIGRIAERSGLKRRVYPHLFRKTTATNAKAILRYLGIAYKSQSSSNGSGSSSGALYRVQVGAFGNEKNAEKLAAELKAKGYSVVIKQY